MRKSIMLALAISICLSATAQELSVSTNVADYINFGTLNMEASYGFARHWSAGADVKYNPFTFTSDSGQKQNRQRSFSAGIRYWPWHIYSGWWIAGNLRCQEYNVGGVKSEETSEGDRLGGGVQGGYSYMISQHLNLNVGAGVWAGKDTYMVYACPRCGRVVDSGSKFFFLPSDIILSLAYIF